MGGSRGLSRHRYRTAYRRPLRHRDRLGVLVDHRRGGDSGCVAAQRLALVEDGVLKSWAVPKEPIDDLTSAVARSTILLNGLGSSQPPGKISDQYLKIVL